MDDVRVVEAPDPRVREFYEQQRLKDAAKNLVVPVDDQQVRQQLRANLLPAELPSESRDARRARLVDFLARKALAEDQSRGEEVSETPPEPRPSYQEEGPPELLRCRRLIAEYTEQTRKNSNAPRAELRWPGTELAASQSGFRRPVSSVSLMPSGVVCVADWSGMLSFLGADVNLATIAKAELGVHISDVATRAQSVASGLLDGSIAVHEFREESVLQKAAMLRGHKARVTAVEFHPLGPLLLSGSHDQTWRLWDVEVGQSLLEQTGHTGAVNALSICADGALAASAGSDRTVKVWDLRSGVLVTTLKNHAADVTAVAWNPTRIQHTMELVSGGGDNRALVWDLRKFAEPKEVLYAHISTITALRYDEAGSTLVSASLDGRLRFWGAAEHYKLRKSLQTGSRILSFDLSGQTLVAGRWDRLVDIYLNEEAV